MSRIYSICGFREPDEQNEWHSLVGKWKQDWASVSAIHKLYQIPIPTLKTWMRNGEINYTEKEGVTYIEKGSVGFRYLGYVCLCEICGRRRWHNTPRRFCSERCEMIATYNKRRLIRKASRDMWIIHPQSLMKFGEVVYRRRRQAKSTLAQYENIVGESRHYLRLVEKGLVAPPTDDDVLKDYAIWLDINRASIAYDRFVELAKREAESFFPQVVLVDIRMSKAGFGFIAELKTKYESKIRAYGETKALAAANLEAMVRLDVRERLIKGKSVFYKPKGFKQMELVFSDGWK